jgi:ATP-dependent RNA helicase DDX54/DBP10
MAPDEAGEARAQKASQLRWDRKRKRFSRAPLNSGNEKMIRSESGALLPATFNSGRFDTWKKRAKGSLGDSQDSLVCRSSCHKSKAYLASRAETAGRGSFCRQRPS